MPVVSVDAASSTDRTEIIESRCFEGGYLFSLVALPLVGETQNGRTHVLAGICNGAPDKERLTAILIDDYVYNGHLPAWTGKVPVENSDYLVVCTRGNDGIIIRVAGLMLKQDP